MEFCEAKQKFISTWGELGCNWGICRTMGHIHAVLLISPEPKSADDIMEELQISRGNANMNLRALLDWGLVYRSSIAGDRKDYFEAEKDLWTVFKKTLAKRKQRELTPMLDMIKSVSDTKGTCPQSNEFKKVLNDLQMISGAAEKSLDKLLGSDSNLLLNALVKVLR
jgi:DNA-binding transcriptional regulator GbsR (MarR family)